MRQTRITYALTATDADGISTSQTPLAAGNLTINGALAAGGSVTLASAQHVTVTVAADETGRTFTVYGTDRDGASITEALAGPASGAVKSTKNFLTITRIAIDDATADALTAGIVDTGNTRLVPLDIYVPHFNVGLAVIVTGTVNFSVTYTVDEVYSSTFSDAAAVWWSITALASKTANTDTALTSPVRAVRATINSGVGTIQFVVTQQGTK